MVVVLVAKFLHLCEVAVLSPSRCHGFPVLLLQSWETLEILALVCSASSGGGGGYFWSITLPDVRYGHHVTYKE